MTTAATNRRLVELSGSQVAALVAGIGGGLATWVAVARVLPPSEVGRVTAVVALASLIAGLVAAGLGQYLLAALPRQPAPARNRTVIASTLGGLIATAVVAVLMGSIARGGSASETTFLAAFAVSVTLVNIQDAVYLCAGSATDIVAKAIAVSALKPLMVLFAGTVEPPAGLTTYDLVVAALLVPSLVVGVAWLLIRVPSSITKIPYPRSVHGHDPFRLLSIGYLYASAHSLVTWGVPALGTNLLAASGSALFYVAWTVASVLGSVPSALGNVVVSRSRGTSETMNGPRIVVAQAAISGALAAAIFVVSPWLLGVFGAYYRAAVPVLGVLLVGQVLSGTSVVLIGFGRRANAYARVAAAITLWACTGFGLPAVAAIAGGPSYSVSYAVGAATGLVLAAAVLGPHVSRASPPSGAALKTEER